MRINHNTIALNAWRNMYQTNSELGKSLEKLSSGSRINRAADDPAGLVISENLRAQITGINQATTNTEDGVSMVQVAEGSLIEMNTMLNSMRALALHAANTGATSASAIAADQQQIDSAVDSINRIATQTAYLGKKLLDGTSGNSVTLNNVGTTASGAISAATLGTAAPTGTNTLDVVITTKSDQALVTANISGTTVSGNIMVNGLTIAIATGQTATATVEQINSALGLANIDITATADSLTAISFKADNYGSAYGVNVVAATGVFNATAGQTLVDYGADVDGTIGGSTATGSGLTLTADSGTQYAGNAVTFTTTGNVTATYTGSLTVIGGNTLTLQVGSSRGETQTLNMANAQATKLGIVTAVGNTTNGLNALKTGGIAALATSAGNALDIIDQAIADVSTMRANLGATQKNVLETSIRSLQVSGENLTASESRIRDLDMAKEMMNFTRNQIMMQAGTAMLAQANAQPQSVLQLLQ